MPSLQDSEQAALEKKKMEEKNRKLWAMSETVHKERKKPKAFKQVNRKQIRIPETNRTITVDPSTSIDTLKV